MTAVEVENLTLEPAPTLLQIQPPRREWEALQIPVQVTFFFTNSDPGRVVAFRPSPAGPEGGGPGGQAP